jgi:hypothetical protein
MTTLKERILNLIRERDNVTFAELSRLDGFKHAVKGKGFCVSVENYPNIIYWLGMSEEAVDALCELREEKKIQHVPTTPITYLIDGETLRLPLAKQARQYKDLHWLPVVLRPA